MSIDELKAEISARTGVPVSLLSGETAEEAIAQARTLLDFKKDSGTAPPKTTKEQFGEWFRSRTGEADPLDVAGNALSEIEEVARVSAGGYPRVQDGGGPYINGVQLPDGRSPADQLRDWLNDRMAFDPRKSPDGWR